MCKFKDYRKSKYDIVQKKGRGEERRDRKRKLVMCGSVTHRLLATTNITTVSISTSLKQPRDGYCVLVVLVFSVDNGNRSTDVAQRRAATTAAPVVQEVSYHVNS